MEHKDKRTIYGTTILAVKKDGETVIAGDGQVSLGNTVMKATARKLRTLNQGKIVGGFAGATADAFTLFERLEAKLEKHQNNLLRAAVELAKDWRTDKYLRRLEAMLLIADKDNILIVSGTGDVIEPEHNVAAIGSGGQFALSAARALIDQENLSAKEVAAKSMDIAADICVYTNHNVIFEEVKA
jgi:ATP-dependent HslUV protease subunit HslV